MESMEAGIVQQGRGGLNLINANIGPGLITLAWRSIALKYHAHQSVRTPRVAGRAGKNGLSKWYSTIIELKLVS